MHPASAALIFDIETVPDFAQARRLEAYAQLTDLEIYQQLWEQPKLWLCQIACISALLITHEQVKLWSVGDESDQESEILERFFMGIEKYKPVLVSWNGKGFDMPVIHYRSLKHGIASRAYWDTGTHDAQFKWNNYLNRYHERHLDLMDVLSNHQPRASAGLDAMATFLGFPGKISIQSDQVWPLYQQGDLAAIRHYCELDVLNTYLIYLQFQRMRDHISPSEQDHRTHQLKQYLQNSEHAHWHNFLDRWVTSNP